MELFKRFPIVRPARKDEPLVPLGERKSKYASFETDFATLDKGLLPLFYKLDYEASLRQYQYRALYLILIFGSLLTSMLGIVQIASPDANWPGILGAVAAAAITIVTALSRTLNHHKRYLDTRLAAERLRSEYFLFLGRCKPYEHDLDRVRILHKHVTDIQGEVKL